MNLLSRSSRASVRWTPRLGAIVHASLLVPLVLGCGGADAGGAAVSEQQAGDVLGTFSGTVEGEEMSWYALLGEIEGQRRPSAFWTVLGEKRLASLSGYDSKEVPFETFSAEPSAGAASFGDYRGSILSVAFPFTASDTELTFQFPPDGAPSSAAMVAYIPGRESKDEDVGAVFERMYRLTEGRLTVSRVEVDGTGPASFEGSFSGTFQKMTGPGSVTIEDGHFEIRRAPLFDLAEARADMERAQSEGGRDRR